MFPKKTLGEKIKERRKALNITQPMLAEMTNIPQSQISKYENGLAEPVASNLLAIIKALEVSADWLLGVDETPQTVPEIVEVLDEQEKEILDVFRSFPKRRKPKIIEMVKLAK